MSQHRLHPGETVGSYVVETFLGRGTTATVYGARHLSDGSRWALKILDQPSSEQLQRMTREAEAMAAVDHEHVVRVGGFLSTRLGMGLLLQRIDGPPLDLLMPRAPFPEAEAVALVAGILSGLQAAHAHQVLHRDLKPANVLVHLSGDVVVPKLVDFGAVKVVAPGNALNTLTKTGTTFGDPRFTAPEQLQDPRAASERSDVFSAGVILYGLLCGRLPFEGRHALEVAMAQEDGYADPASVQPGLSPGVVEALGRMLTLDPAQRVQSAAEALEALPAWARQPVSRGVIHGAARSWEAEHRGQRLAAPELPTVEAAPVAASGSSGLALVVMAVLAALGLLAVATVGVAGAAGAWWVLARG